jgi:elongation factor G
VLNTRTGKKERISRIFQMHAKEQKPVDKVEAGDIAAGVGFKDIKTGDTLVMRRTLLFLKAWYSLSQ